MKKGCKWGNAIIRFISKSSHLGCNGEKGFDGGKDGGETSSNTMECGAT